MTKTKTEELHSDLLRRLAESRGLNRTPPDVLEQASDAFSARQKESRLLELVYDSLIDSEITVETAEGPVQAARVPRRRQHRRAGARPGG